MENSFNSGRKITSTPPLVPDVQLDFATGHGIPTAAGGLGGPGSELVQVSSPQDSGGGARLVRAPRYWDPTAHWRPGEPIFAPKQSGRLVGWPGPRAGGYWTGPMPSLSSTSETVAVYSNATGRTVTTVAGGVVGPAALRCDVAAGQTGDGWPAAPAPVMTSGWTVDANGDGTVCYMHAVVELLGDVSYHRFRFALYDQGASAAIEQITQRYDAPDQQRAGRIFRGVGPHGGQLYEIWALARLISSPVGPLSALTYLLSSGSGSNPARTVIVHGCQTHFVVRSDANGIAGLLPFFSYARGVPVIWANESLRVNITDVAYSAALKARANQFAVGATRNYGEAVARNGWTDEVWWQIHTNVWRALKPSVMFIGFDSRVAFRTGTDYSRAATVDGNTVVSGGVFSLQQTPAYLEIGRAHSVFFGRFARLALWLRALTDAELLRAFRMLGDPLP